MRRASLPFRSKLPNTRRRRPLTPPLPSDIRPRPNYFQQAQCPLLFDLPYELRFQIYTELLGDGVVFVEQVEDWGEGKTKRKKKKKSKKSKKRVDGEDQEEDRTAGGNTDLKTLFALLQTCRLAYTELLPLIMSCSIKIPTLATLRHHLDRIPAKHFDLITDLTLTICLPYLLFPVRQLPAPNTWIGRTIKQLQHFDVPLWNSVWYGLAGGVSGIGGAINGGAAGGQVYPSGNGANSASSSGENLRRASIVSGPGLTGLRFFHVSITARDYTSLHPEWPNAPEDSVANLLWEPVLAFARSRGWPRCRPQLQKQRSSRRVHSVAERIDADGVGNEDQEAQGVIGSFPQWTMEVSWSVHPEKFGRGGPPERMFRGSEEKNAGLPFVLRTIESIPEATTQAGSVDFAVANMPGGGTDSPSSSEEETDEEDDDRDEDEGYRSGGAQVEAQQPGQTQRPRQWWEG